MIGRPSVMTTETLDMLRGAYLMGYSDREACVYANIGLQTLYDYQKEHPEFSEQKEEYKANPVLLAKKTIFGALEKGNIKIAQWYLERKAREEFSSKKEFGERQPTARDIEQLSSLFESGNDKETKAIQNELEQVWGNVPTYP